MNYKLEPFKYVPDFQSFRNTDVYKETKALNGLPANSELPYMRSSLLRSLHIREMGCPSMLNSFRSANALRGMANEYSPNSFKQLDDLKSKVFVSRFNKTGELLFTSCLNNNVRIYDASKGIYNLLGRYPKNGQLDMVALDIDVSPCNKYFAMSTFSPKVRIFNIESGEKRELNYLRLDLNDNNFAFTVRYSPCGDFLLAGLSNSSAYMANLETGKVTSMCRVDYTGIVTASAFLTTKDPNMFLTGSDSGYVKLWDVRIANYSTHSAVSNFLGHFAGVMFIDSKNDYRYVLSHSRDESVRIWDMRKPSPAHFVHEHRSSIFERSIFKSNKYDKYDYPAVCVDGDVSLMTFYGHRAYKSFTRARFSPKVQTGHRYVYTGCTTGKVIIYDVLTGKMKRSIQAHKSIVRDLAWHPVRSEIVSSSFDGKLCLNTYNPLNEACDEQY